MLVCDCNPVKIAHHSKIFIRKNHLKGSNMENKAIPSPTCN